jgi:hypothetical protein
MDPELRIEFSEHAEARSTVTTVAPSFIQAVFIGLQAVCDRWPPKKISRTTRKREPGAFSPPDSDRFSFE